MKCRVCGNEDTEKIALMPTCNNVKRYMCFVCGLRFIFPETQEKPVYDQSYNTFFNRPGDAAKAGIMAKRVAEIAFQTKLSNNKPKVLEIGCGNAWTAWLLKELGCDVVCHEIDEKYAFQVYRSKGIDTMWGDFEHTKYTRYLESFDVIYAGHVIEHSWEPMLFLQQCKNLLRPGGILFLDTPNADRSILNEKNWHHFNTRDPNEHCTVFNPKCMKKAAEIAGLEVLHTTILNQYDSFQVILRK